MQNAALRGIARGAAYGLGVGIVEAWLGLIPLMNRRMGPGSLFVLETLLLEIALGAALGLLASPALRLRRGAVAHLLVLVLAWLALEKWVEVDSPLFTPVQLVPPLAGGILFLLGLWLRRFRVWLPLAAGAALAAGGSAAPPVYLWAVTPELARPESTSPARPGAPDVVLVVLDTVRAENLSAYGYERATSPVLSALAEEGALFLDATSPSTWSLPSHASLFTGRYPSGHGANAEHRYLDDAFPTLAQALALAGYETFCFTANSWISDGLGLTRGFHWQHAPPTAGIGRTFSFIHRLLARLGVEAEDKGGGSVAGHFEEWARERRPDAPPAFVFLNFIEAHFPYHVLPDEYLSRFTKQPRSELRALSLELLGAQFGGSRPEPARARQAALDMYDGGVLYSDHLLGRLVEALRSEGRLDRTILIVLGDHGELLGERGNFFGHGPSLYQVAVHVPLVVRYPPAVPRARVATPVSTVGVFATVLELLGVEPPPTLQVGSLLPALEGRPGAGPVLSELFRMESMIPGDGRLGDEMMQASARYRAYRSESWKLVEASSGETFLFDLAADPDEQRDLAQERPEQLALLQRGLAQVGGELGLPALDAELASGPAPELDADTKERLRALGYAE